MDKAMDAGATLMAPKGVTVMSCGLSDEVTITGGGEGIQGRIGH